MTKSDLVQFIAKHKYAVLATTAPDGQPQAAVVGIAVTADLELYFDTLGDTRKAANLRHDPRIAFVVGTGPGAQTVQYEGIADEPVGPALAALKTVYFETFPDGRERELWRGISYFRVRPRWIRFSDFGGASPHVEHFDATTLGA